MAWLHPQNQQPPCSIHIDGPPATLRPVATNRHALWPVGRDLRQSSPSLPARRARETLDILERRSASLEEGRGLIIRVATVPEREKLSRFCGFGPVAPSLFPGPDRGDVQGRLVGGARQATSRTACDRRRIRVSEAVGLQRLLLHRAGGQTERCTTLLTRLGLAQHFVFVLEPGAGVGRSRGPGSRGHAVHRRGTGWRLGQDRVCCTRALTSADPELPGHETPRPRRQAIGNVPFANVKLEHGGTRWTLHDYFFAKSVDALKPGGVLALVTSHYTLDKQNAAIREYLSDRADFLGAIRLPSDAFKKEGTAVVTDIVFLRKRAPGEPENHVDFEWKQSAPAAVEDSFVPINRYFLNHPEMVLGTFTSKDSLYGEGYSVVSNGDLAEQLRQAVAQIPRFEPTRSEAQQANPPPDHQVNGSHRKVAALNHQLTPLDRKVTPTFVPPPPRQRHHWKAACPTKAISVQLVDGQSAPIVYGGSDLWANGALFGRRMGALIELRDKARYVLRSQNEGWPDSARSDARRALNAAYDRFKSTRMARSSKTTLLRDAGRQHDPPCMPSLAKFREDPDAMLVMGGLEEYDEATGEAA